MDPGKLRQMALAITIGAVLSAAVPAAFGQALPAGNAGASKNDGRIGRADQHRLALNSPEPKASRQRLMPARATDASRSWRARLTQQRALARGDRQQPSSAGGTTRMDARAVAVPTAGPIATPNPPTRLSRQAQRDNIREQRRHLSGYRRDVAQNFALSAQVGRRLREQNRIALYEYQQHYYRRMVQQQLGFQREHHDYDNDPYYYTAASHRYSRGGRQYETNRHGAEVLHQAVNHGYQEGFRSGRADHQDNWRPSYRDSFAYQDANYGYSGYYVRQDDYNHYFREGFQRGYEDGYHSHRRYGRNANGPGLLLGAELEPIPNLQAVR